MTVGPLGDILVLDLSRALAGPIAAMMLGDLGARVIKVEAPGTGDDSRTWGPPFVGPADDPQSSYFMSANRNKESIVLDLKSEHGKDALRRLIRRADVLIENLRPGAFDRLGFPADVLEELNPRLITLSITGFGHDGPEGSRAGYDQIAQGEAGLMSVTGDPDGEPTRIGIPIADVLAGVHGTAGVSAALASREKTGKGMVVRTSLLAAAISAHTFQGTKWTVGGQVAQRSGNHHPQIAPYGSFRCADGYVQIAVGSEAIWEKFAPVAGLSAQDPRFAVNRDRVAAREALIAAIEADFADRTRVDVLAALEAAGVPAGSIRTIDEVYEWEQTRSQGLLVQVEHPVVGPVQLPGPSLRMETADGASLVRSAHAAPPVLGQHTEQILDWLDSVDAADPLDAMVPAQA
ncbi:MULTISPECIES: CaiB/BaiF CoA transferase family protein [Rhodococcus]|uniref:Probable formyl-CoA transferase n=1 Tax=Rhodococcus jostii (strain RHA1) TaxID=101510 RepID=Q0S0U6_RHOJR|nr:MULTISPECIES: CoA transferase [Rhodococcus]ABG98840.1 probable formyl-CoA transferase [Rhodococcus jostii RHA1]